MCFGFLLHITLTTPLRRIILQLSHIFFTEACTFIIASLKVIYICKQSDLLSNHKEKVLLPLYLPVKVLYNASAFCPKHEQVLNAPLQFLQGHGNIIPGLEAHLGGLAIGESLEVTVAAQDGYGEFDSTQIVDVPLSEFPDEIRLEPGVELEMADVDGNLLFARILSVGKSRAKLDFNHPLAGKDLHFNITIVDLRRPTAEELEHRHVHQHL